MSRRSMLIMTLGAAAVGTALSCTDIPTSDTAVLSISFDSLPSPSVVLGDTLRDSTGKAVALNATVYNFKGTVVSQTQLRFLSLDRGVTVDSLTGFAIGDSVRQTPARIVVSVGTLQAVQLLDIALRPDTVTAVNPTDSLLYSLLDSTRNFSSALTVKVLHSLTSPDSAVKSYIVSFAVVSPADTLLGRLVNDVGQPSRVDTSDATGTASRRIFLTPLRLTSLTDSITVRATVKYRGVDVKGSPLTFVLKVKPGTP